VYEYDPLGRLTCAAGRGAAPGPVTVSACASAANDPIARFAYRAGGDRVASWSAARPTVRTYGYEPASSRRTGWGPAGPDDAGGVDAQWGLGVSGGQALSAAAPGPLEAEAYYPGNARVGAPAALRTFDYWPSGPVRRVTVQDARGTTLVHSS
jgi:hypothetical protein